MADCAVMGVDWRDLTWWQYQALLNRWNARSAPSEGVSTAGLDIDRMRDVLAAHS